MKRIKFQERRELLGISFHRRSEELITSPKSLFLSGKSDVACVHHIMDQVVDYSTEFSFEWHSTRFVRSKK